MEITKALKILEIPSQATSLEIKKAYRKLSLLWHPDKYEQNPTKHPANSKEEAEDKMKEINQAYVILTEKEKSNDFGVYNDDVWLAKTKIEVFLDAWNMEPKDIFEEGKAEDDYFEMFKKCQTKEELKNRVDWFLFRIQIFGCAYESGFLRKKSKEEMKRELDPEIEEEKRKRKWLEEQNKKIEELEKRWEELQKLREEKIKRASIIFWVVILLLLFWWGWRKIKSIL